jgi:predicted nucleotide-binding protein
MNTDEVKAKHYWLVVRGENYVSRPGTVGARGLKTWQNNCVRWLRSNLPDSGLVEDVLLVPPPSRNIQGRGLTPNDVRNVQRVLKALYNARELLPFLADSTQQRAPRSENVRRVFIVHGHNEALKIAVARLMEKLDLDPIILHEQPNRGRTIIEKFLEHSDVGFAVVLLTGDDRGGLANASSDEYQLRARQNVILELGYFIGRLGRKNVAAIYQQDVEIPSDYSGVLFIPYDDAGVWQLQLSKEIKAAGIRVDMNRL